MSLTHEQIHELAHALIDADHKGTPILPLTEQAPGITVEDAYAIAADVLGHELEHGHRIVGRKVGLTSKPMQVALGIDTPDFGTILDDMTVRDSGKVKAASLIQPKVEPEIAFRLKTSLRGPGVTMEDVLAATDYVFPALEIIDSRIEGWRIKEQDTVADNGSSARVVVGSTRLPVDALDLDAEEVVFFHNGVEVGQSDVVRSPWQSGERRGVVREQAGGVRPGTEAGRVYHAGLHHCRGGREGRRFGLRRVRESRHCQRELRLVRRGAGTIYL